MTDRVTVRGAAKTANGAISVPAMLLSIALLVGLVVASWAYYGWRVDKEAEIRRGSFNFQETIRDELLDQFDDIATVDVQLADPALTSEQAAALRAQRQAMVNQLCSLAGDVQGDLTSIQQQIIYQEC